MFIAHIPAGYLLTKAIVRNSRPDYRRLMAVGLVGSVLPDFDLLYHYLIDARAHEHHAYVSHTPAPWLLLAALTAVGLIVSRRSNLLIYVGVALANVLLHLVLDSVASHIMWLYPVSDRMFGLVQVPDVYQPWILNFILHWTFGLELLIVAAGFVVFLLARRPSRFLAPRNAHVPAQRRAGVVAVEHEVMPLGL